MSWKAGKLQTDGEMLLSLENKSRPIDRPATVSASLKAMEVDCV